MTNDNLPMSSQPTLDLPILPVPKDEIPFTVSRTDPSAVGREADLARVACDAVSCEALFSILSEVVGGVDEDLVVEGLGCEPFFC